MGDFFVGNQSSGFCEVGCAAIVDSGTFLLTGPTVRPYKVGAQIGLCFSDVAQYVRSGIGGAAMVRLVKHGGRRQSMVEVGVGQWLSCFVLRGNEYKKFKYAGRSEGCLCERGRRRRKRRMTASFG